MSFVLHFARSSSSKQRRRVLLLLLRAALERRAPLHVGETNRSGACKVLCALAAPLRRGAAGYRTDPQRKPTYRTRTPTLAKEVSNIRCDSVHANLCSTLFACLAVGVGEYPASAPLESTCWQFSDGPAVI